MNRKAVNESRIGPPLRTITCEQVNHRRPRDELEVKEDRRRVRVAPFE
jgi:hypothetical protein